jgi:hypothetical protein
VKHTNTYIGATTILRIQDDANLVVYDTSYNPKWALSWWAGNLGAGASFMTAQ